MDVHGLGSAWVTPDWLPLALVVVLLAVIALLYWSMRHHLSRIDLQEDRDDAGEDAS